MTAETLKDLFWDKLSSCGTNDDLYSPAYQAKEKALILESALLDRCKDEDSKLFNDMVEAYLEYIDLLKKEKFIEGVRIGGRLMLEIIDSTDLNMAG